MSSGNNVGDQIQKIKNIFQHAQHTATTEEDVNKLIDHLENADPEFRSIAYEGASMGLALKDLSQGGTLHRWRSLMEGPGAAHTTQVHVGLGWALAKQGLPVSSFLEELNPLLRFRVLDGYGYFDALFKTRQTIQNQRRPEDLQENFFAAYDQGVGRSIWYSSEGECSKISEIIAKFESSRQPDLWRGIGIACSYVGGFEKTTLDELAVAASKYRVQLAVGAALAARSRIHANSLTQDAELACSAWCNCSAEQAINLTIKTEPSFSDNPEGAFKTWISKMEFELHLS